VLDVAYVSTRADGGGSLTQLSTDSNTSSRLGFRGTEDLGAGLKAGFWLEAAVTPDSGVGGSTSTTNKDSVNNGGLTFGRRSTVSLIDASLGELRLGRDYVPSFNNLTVAMHPFGTNGLGNAGQLFYPVAAGGTTARTNVRASNSIGYILPSGLGGFNGHLMYALGEQASNAGATSKDGNHLGIRIGYGSGPFNAAYATGTTKYATGDYTQSNFAANYQLGAAKLMYLYGINKVGATQTKASMIGTQYDVASGQIRAAYTALTAQGVANDANQIAIGYVHNLSKRTALFTNYSQVKNKGSGIKFVVGGGNAVTQAGGTSSGIEFGVRHSF